jgi:hypothetical protein
MHNKWWHCYNTGCNHVGKLHLCLQSGIAQNFRSSTTGNSVMLQLAIWRQWLKCVHLGLSHQCLTNMCYLTPIFSFDVCEPVPRCATSSHHWKSYTVKIFHHIHIQQNHISCDGCQASVTAVRVSHNLKNKDVFSAPFELLCFSYLTDPFGVYRKLALIAWNDIPTMECLHSSSFSVNFLSPLIVTPPMTVLMWRSFLEEPRQTQSTQKLRTQTLPAITHTALSSA